MHLTNYFLDENNVEDDFDIDKHRTRSLVSLFKSLNTQERDVDKLWKEIKVKMKYILKSQ